MQWPAEVTDVTIVGGGIIGLTTAYVLRQRALAADSEPTIRVVEQASFGSGSTTRAGCGIRTFYRTPVNRELAQAGLQFWRNAPDILNRGIGFREAGYLFLTNSDDIATSLAQQAAVQRANGEPATYSSPPAAPVPDALRIENYQSAVHTPRAALATPEKMIAALLGALDEPNTTLHADEPVVDLNRENGRVAVTTKSDTFQTDVVVNAAGGWANEVAELVGETLPISLQARRLARLDETTPLVPLTVDLDTGVYVLSNEAGQLLAGGKFGEVSVSSPTDTDAFDRTIDETWNEALTDAGENLHDALGTAPVEESWTGLYAMTESRRPIIDESDSIIHATGFSGHGIMQAPGAAQVVADIICDSDTAPVSRDPLRRNREPTEPDLQF